MSWCGLKTLWQWLMHGEMGERACELEEKIALSHCDVQVMRCKKCGAEFTRFARTIESTHIEGQYIEE